MLIAVPSDAPGGLEATISEHFGHSAGFTLVQCEGTEIGETKFIANESHEHGGCMGPVMLLKNHGVDALICGGMGQRPLEGFRQVNIAVYFKEAASTVKEAVEQMTAGKCREFGEQHTCGGHGHDHQGCGGHGHGTIDLEPFDGPVEQDRVVQFSYEMFDPEGKMIDSSEVRYVHGYNQVLAGLENALTGRAAGDNFEVTIGPQDGFGEYKESNIIDIPAANAPQGLSVGQMVQGQNPEGKRMPMIVKAIEDDKITLDANHPLAGKTACFKIKVIKVFSQIEKK